MDLFPNVKGIWCGKTAGMQFPYHIKRLCYLLMVVIVQCSGIRNKIRYFPPAFRVPVYICIIKLQFSGYFHRGGFASPVDIFWCTDSRMAVNIFPSSAFKKEGKIREAYFDGLNMAYFTFLTVEYMANILKYGWMSIGQIIFIKCTKFIQWVKLFYDCLVIFLYVHLQVVQMEYV